MAAYLIPVSRPGSIFKDPKISTLYLDACMFAGFGLSAANGKQKQPDFYRWLYIILPRKTVPKTFISAGLRPEISIKICEFFSSKTDQ
jgi:hypothetical protein